MERLDILKCKIEGIAEFKYSLIFFLSAIFICSIMILKFSVYICFNKIISGRYNFTYIGMTSASLTRAVIFLQ
jgi:hypothetical protein